MILYNIILINMNVDYQQNVAKQFLLRFHYFTFYFYVLQLVKTEGIF